MSHIQAMIAFFDIAEKLKCALRHSWLSDSDRQESVAEHTWMMCLMAIAFFQHMKVPVDQLRVLKIVIVHDLVEALDGDTPAFMTTDAQQKEAIEREHLQKITHDLSTELRTEITELWEEYVAAKTPEAKMAKALDKLEVIMQHNRADIASWIQGDFDIQPYYQDEKFNFDEFFRAFKDYVDRMSMEKIYAAQAQHKISAQHRERYENSRDH